MNDTPRSLSERLVPALLALSAMVLLAGSPASGGAEQDPPGQGVDADVTSQISWGSAGGCIQNIQTNNFGDLTPGTSGSLTGAFAATPESAASIDGGGNHVWVGCVTANGPLVSVAAQSVQNMHDSKGDLLPLADVAIGITNTPGGQPPAGCAIAPGELTAGSCTLPDDGSTVRQLIGEQPPGTTELDWQYQLNLPANQPSGTYTGGEVIFTATASAPEIVAPPANTTPPEISPQTPKQGASLTTTDGSWSNSPTTYSYQWERCDEAGENCGDIAGASAQQYTPTSADVGKRLRAQVTASNTGGETTAQSTLSEPVQAEAPVNTLQPSITPADPEEGVAEHLSTGTWTNNPTSFSYQWERCDEAGKSCTEISGAKEADYTPIAEDVGHTLTAAVTATNSGGSASASGTATEVVVIAPPTTSTPPPTITGTTAQGHVLSTTNGTFGGGAISTYSYQWQDCEQNAENCVDISGANGSTYILSPADVSHTVLVQVTASNAKGSATESSQATAVISGPPINTQAPALASSTPVVDVQDSVTAGTWTESPTSYAYQWQLCDASGSGCENISGAEATTYTPVSADAGHTLRAEVTATDQDGTGNAVSNTSGVIGESPENVQAPALSNEEPVKGEQLSVSSGTWSGTPESFIYTYQWLRCDAAGEHCVEISGASFSSYTPVAADVAHTLIARVIASNTAGMTSALSEKSEAVLAGNPVDISPPGLTPTTPQQGVAERASTGTWTQNPTSYTYQWERCDGLGASCLPIAGATDSTYTPTSEDVSDTLEVEVIATNAAGSGAASSSPSNVVVPAAPVNTMAPAYSPSTPQQGVSEGVSTGTWSNSPTGFAYQWELCNASGGECSDIAGATSSSYTPSEEDVGRRLRANVTATNAGGSASSAPATPVVVPADPTDSVLPTISPATPQQGIAESTTTGTWSNSPSGYTYQWQDCNSSGEGCSSISGATSSSYTPVEGDVGHTLTVQVTATNAGGSATATAKVTAAVLPAAPGNTVAPSISSENPAVGVLETATTGSWTNNPTSYAYQWRHCNSSGESCTDISGATSPSYTPQSSDAGFTLVVEVKASNAGGSSAGIASKHTNLVTQAPSETSPPALSTGSPTEGVALSVSNGTWAGYPAPAYAYQWQRCNSLGASCVNISGATSSSYTPVTADVGETIQAIVTATNSSGSASASTALSNIVTSAPANTQAPSLSTSSAPVEGTPISVSTGTWRGYPTPTYIYQWLRCNGSGESCVNISGATSSSYTPVSADVAHTLQAKVTATNTVGSSSASTTASTVVVPPAPVNIMLPTMSASAALVQQVESTSSSTLTLGQNVTAGDLLVLVVCQTSSEITAVAGGGVTWKRAVQNGGKDCAIWYGESSLGGEETREVRVTGTLGGAPGLALSEWSGVAAKEALDSSGAYEGSLTPLATPEISLASAGELIIVGDVTGYGSPHKVTPGFTGFFSGSLPTYTDAEYLIDTNGGTIKGTWEGTLEAYSGNAAIISSFKSPPTVGRAVTAANGTWSNSPTGYAYQWEDCGSSGEGCASIAGATGSSYVPVVGDVGHSLRVVVTASNAGGSGSSVSAATAAVLPAVPVNTAAPSISSESPAVGVLETATTGSWTNSPTSYAYQWLDCNSAGEGCLSITGATGSSYTPQSSDAGHTLILDVKASNAGGSSALAASKHTNPVTQAPSDTTLPALSTNSPTEGVAVSVSNGAWAGYPAPTYTYQWQRCNAFAGECVNISGATSSSYTPVATDVGNTIQAVVDASNTTGSASATTLVSSIVTGAPGNMAAPSLSSSSPVEGTSLSSSSGTWAGYPSPTFAYQWEDCNTAGESCSNIAGATSSSYTPASSDVGHTLRVKVTATNSVGANTAMTEASNVVVPPAPVNSMAPAVSPATPQQGVLESSTNGTWSNSPTSYTYQWEDCNSSGGSCSNISGATSSSYTPTPTDVGHTLRLIVTATNAGGSGKATSGASNVVVPPAPVNSTLPSVSGTTEEGQVLTASNGSWSNSPTSYSYQWARCNTSGESCANISGATSSSYTLAAGDVGHKLRVEVTATNAGGSGSATSEPTAVVVPPAPVSSVLPVISSSSPQQGVAESTTNGTWSNSPTSYSYQWEDCNSAGEACTNVSGATSSSYTPVEGDVGHKLRVKVTAANAGGSGSATSEPTAVVVPPAPVNSVLPVISSSSPRQGVAESTTNGTWSNSPTSYSYQWEDCNSAGEACTNVSGATSSSYTPVEGDVGHKLRVKVTAANAGGSGSATSEPTGVVVPPAPVNSVLPSISPSSPRQGVAESTTNGTWSNSPTSYSYQWEDCNGAGESCSTISGATSSSYTPASSDIGHTLRVKVTAANAGGSGSATSEPTATVVPPAPTNSVLPVVSPSSPQQGVAESTTTGTWSNSPTSYAYQWEDCNSLGESCLNISGATSSSYTPAASDVSYTLRVKVTATNAGGSGTATSEPTAVVVPPAPANSVLPVISSSSPQQGVAESTTNGTWSNSPTSYSYQWEDCNSAGEACTNVSGATSSSYTPASSDVGDKLRVKVTATNAGGAGSATSEPTAVVVPPAPVNSQAPVISPSSPKQGVAESTTNGTWSNSPTSYAYQWQDCNSAGESCSSISGATSSSYTPVEADAGHTLRVEVTATNSGGSGHAQSAATATVLGKPTNTVLPAITESRTGGLGTLNTADGTNDITAVSCPSSGFCVAVDSSGNVLATTNSGSSWTVTAISGAPSFVAVSCAPGTTSTSGLCAATSTGVHAYLATDPTGGAAAWVESASFTGSEPPGGISCANTAFCVAVAGGYTNIGAVSGTAVTWTENSANASSFAGVSCTSETFCAHIDSSAGVVYTTTPKTIATWTATSGVTLTGGTGEALSCAPGTTSTSGLCVDVGTSGRIAVATDPAGTWTTSTIDGAHTITSVSCASTSFCVAVDNAGNVLVSRTPTEASSWSQTGSGASDLTGASCYSTTFCVIVDNLGQGAVYSGAAVTTLKGSSGTWSNSPTSYTYQWERCNSVGAECSSISGATSSSRTETTEDAGHTLRIEVTATNAAGSGTATSSQSLVGGAPVNTAVSTIEDLGPGVLSEPDTADQLEATDGIWANEPTSYTYQWEDCNTAGESCSNISGATGVEYEPVSADIGHTLRVVITVTNSYGSAKATTAQTGVVKLAPPVNTVLPAITGSPVVAQVLTSSTGTWSNEPTSYTYQWEDCNTAGESCSNISGATASSYTVASTDVGHTIRVVVTATNSTGSTVATSTYTARVASAAPVNTAPPTITGTAKVGEKLTGSTGTWNNEPTSYKYQWERCNSVGAECTSISGATTNSRTETTEDAGHTLRIEVTATNAAGSTKATSAQSGVVAAADYTQAVDANALEATSCIPSTTDCVVSDNKGNAYYSTNAKATGAATWNSWTGPSASASEALACPSTSLCTIADGGNVYYATSLGGAWTEAFSPSYKVDALTCASSSFCIDGQGESGGYIRYSTDPASNAWEAVLIAGSNNVTGVSCLSSSFCTAVDSVGEAYIATTEARIKEAAGWKGTDVDSTTALDGIACMSTTSCVAVDDAGNVLALTINSEGAATVSKHDIDGTNDLTAVACTGSSTCVAVDTVGNVFLSTNAGATWTKQYALGVDLTSVSCASALLCVAVNTAGSVTTFEG
jgi:P2-related tail formation protein